MIHACLNGDRPPGAHPPIPVTPDELARAAKAFDELEEQTQPKDELVSLFSLTRNRKPDPPS
jgi:hypothetical protein